MFKELAGKKSPARVLSCLVIVALIVCACSPPISQQATQPILKPEVEQGVLDKALEDYYAMWKSGNHFTKEGQRVNNPGYVQAFQLPTPLKLPWEEEGSTEGAVVLMIPNGTASEMPGDYCVSTDEAMGYGMIIAAHFKDWDLFDRLLRVCLYYRNYNQNKFIATGNGWTEHLTSWAIPAKRGVNWFKSETFLALSEAAKDQWKAEGIQYDPLYLEGTDVPESVIVGESNHVRNSGGSATDGELDIAYALYLASIKYEGDKDRANAYKKLSIARYDAIFEILVGDYGYLLDCTDCELQFLPTGDYRVQYMDQQRSRFEGLTRPCDWMNAQLRVYYNLTGNQQALDLINDIYGYVDALSDPNTGLVPDFAAFFEVDGRFELKPIPMSVSNEWQSEHFYMNSARYPFRMAMDYYLYGDKRGLAASSKVLDFFIDKYKFEQEEDFERYPFAMYTLEGESVESAKWQNPVLNACLYASAAMTGDKKYQAFVNAGWHQLTRNFDSRYYDWDQNGLALEPSHSGYFGDTWTLLAMLMMSGKW